MRVDHNIVDLEVQHEDGGRALVVQVKSVASPETARPVGAAAAIDVLSRLAHSGLADRYEYVTNQPLSDKVALLQQALESSDPAQLDDWVAAASLVGRELSPQVVQRLRRARIVSLSVDSAGLRVELRERIKAIRQSRRVGTGVDAAGMITMFLTAKVFQAATGEVSARVSAADAEDWLRVPPADVAAATGWFDWGVPIGAWPPLPSVQRSQLAELSDVLLPAAVHSRTSRAVVLTGLSGSGKSSLACSFAHLWADSYDVLWWVDCESEDSVRASVRRLAQACQALRLTVEPPSGLEDVVRFLNQLPGPWLVVLDNLADRDLLARLVPTAGRGQTIVTTTDATLLHGTARIAVLGLSDDEAVALFRSIHADDDTEAVQELCQALGDLALGVSMAAGYLASAQRRLAGGTRRYLEEIAVVAASSEMAIPPGYSHTLAASVELNLQRLLPQAKSAQEAALEWILPLRLALAASLFAETDIPVHLLWAAAMMTPEAHRQSGLADIVRLHELHDADLDDAVIRLRRVSLIERRQVLSTSALGDFTGDRLAMNGIVQRLIQVWIQTKLPEGFVQEACRKAVYHVGNWLRVTIDDQHVDDMFLLLPHAARVEHLARTRTRGLELCALEGNIALAYRGTGQPHRALPLLIHELETLRSLEDGHAPIGRRLAAQTLVQVVQLEIDLGVGMNTVIDHIHDLTRLLEEQVSAGQVLTTETPGSIARSVINASLLLRVLARTNVLGEAGEELRYRLNVLSAHVSDGGLAAQVAHLDSLEELLNAGGGDARVIRELSQYMAPGYKPHIASRAHGMAAEASAWADDLSQALHHLRAMSDLEPDPRVHRPEVLLAVQNVGVATGRFIVTGRVDAVTKWSAADLLNTVIQISAERVEPGTYEMRVHRIFEAMSAVLAGNCASAMVALTAARETASFVPHSVSSTVALEVFASWVARSCADVDKKA